VFVPAPNFSWASATLLPAAEQELSDALAAPVEIRLKKRTARGEQGEVAIRFGSLDELNGLLEKLGLPPR
jgi:ParB family chromosome partitioning protein